MKWLIWIKYHVDAPALSSFQVSDRIEESNGIEAVAKEIAT